MRAVAEWGVAGILATAEQGRFGSFCGEHQGFDPGAGVRAIAKRLLLASPAPAPSIAFSRFELDLIGAELRPFWLRHDHSL
jgi:hypothetical protein